jgi:hypothetical protein
MMNLSLEEMCAALEKRVAAAQVRKTAPPQRDAHAADFESCVSEILKRDHCGANEALRRARLEHPRALERFQADQPDIPVRKRATVEPAVVEFMREVDRTMITEGMLPHRRHVGGAQARSRPVRRFL